MISCCMHIFHVFVSPQIYLVVISFMLVSYFHCAAKQNYLRWSSRTPCIIQYWLKPSEQAPKLTSASHYDWMSIVLFANPYDPCILLIHLPTFIRGGFFFRSIVDSWPSFHLFVCSKPLTSLQLWTAATSPVKLWQDAAAADCAPNSFPSKKSKS